MITTSYFRGLFSYWRGAVQRHSAQSNRKRRVLRAKGCSRILLLVLCGLFTVFTTTPAHAVALNDWIFNVDGTVSENFNDDPFPLTGTLDENGYGTLILEVTGAGSHNIIGFFDFEIDQSANTYYNEFAEVTGTPEFGQSWEVDEPGWVFGDITDNVFYGELDNTNAVPSGSEEDVSIAIGWNFSLLPDDVAIITFTISDVLPDVNFYLTQADPDDPNRDFAFYFYSEVSLQSSGEPSGPAPTPGPPQTPVPEPGTALLMLSGIIAIWVRRHSM